MRRFGFSTGALAKGDFREGIARQPSRAQAIELSALREHELIPLIEALPELDLGRFSYISFHAPSRLSSSEAEIVERLSQLPAWIEAIVVHPDLIQDFASWRALGNRLAIENMDQRYAGGRSAKELAVYFQQLPAARFCFDIGHARQVDPTMSIGAELLREFGDRLAEVHLSEVNAESQHCPISYAASRSFQRLLGGLPDSVPAIVESIVDVSGIAEELRIARLAFGMEDQGSLPVGREPLVAISQAKR